MISGNGRLKRILGRKDVGLRDVWARPGMSVTFRAELMPGRAASERTFRVMRVLGSLRVLVEGIAGEHAAAEFDLKS